MCTDKDLAAIPLEFFMTDTRGDMTICHNCVVCPSDLTISSTLSRDGNDCWVYEHWFCSEICKYEYLINEIN